MSEAASSSPNNTTTIVPIPPENGTTTTNATTTEATEKNNSLPGTKWLGSSVKSSAAYLIRVTTNARSNLLLDSQQDPFLTILRFSYALLLLVRVVTFISFAGMNQVSSDWNDDPFGTFTDTFLSGSLIPVLSIGIAGVLTKRSCLYWIAVLLQLCCCFCWYARTIMFLPDSPAESTFQAVYFAYDLVLVTLTLWIIREHYVSNAIQLIRKQINSFPINSMLQILPCRPGQM